MRYGDFQSKFVLLGETSKAIIYPRLNKISSRPFTRASFSHSKIRPTVLFDWGDTIMRDDPEITIPMVEWDTVEVIDGIADVLGYLHSSGRRIVLATSASISDESQIRGVLARGGLDNYFSRIYCFKNTHIPKGEAFYRHILRDLCIAASEALIVGDGFEKDVQAANAVGIFAVWFNPKSEETRTDQLHVNVHSRHELRAFFKSLD